MAALANRDIDALFGIVDAKATAELAGGNIMEGLEKYKIFFSHMLAPVPLFRPEHEYPRHELVSYRGETVILGYRFWNEWWRFNEVSRLEEIDGKVSKIRCYCWSPDTLRFIGEELNIAVLTDAEGLADALQKLIGTSKPSPTGGYRSP